MRLGNPLTYLIHFNQRYRHAGHYTGSSRDLAARLADHASGRGARLMEVVNDGRDRVAAGPGLGRRPRPGAAVKAPGRRLAALPGVQGPAARPRRRLRHGTSPGQPRRARAGQPAAERAEEPLWESVAAYLTGGEAAALLGELKTAERDAWQQAAREAGQHRSAALEMACDLSRLRSAEASAADRLAEAREIAEREGWTEADLDPQPMTDQHSAGRSQPAPITPQQEGPEMGNFTEERETVESARDAGAQEADEVAMAAIRAAGMTRSSSPTGRGARSEGLHGAAASDADRAFADGFERQALQASADYDEAGRELAACYREPGSPHPDPDLAARGWHVSECGVYSRARAGRRARPPSRPSRRAGARGLLMSAQDELARQVGDVATFADDDPLISPDDQAPYELTDLARAYLHGLTDDEAPATPARPAAGQ